MASLIPEYSINRPVNGQLDFSMFNDVIDGLKERGYNIQQQQRLKEQAINKQLSSIDPVKDLIPMMQQKASEAITELNNKWAERITYDKGVRGVSKLKRHLGLEPSLTDEEAAQTLQEAAQLAAKLDSLRNDFQEVNKETTEFNKNRDLYDPREYEMRVNDFYATGERPIDENGRPISFLSPKPKDVFSDITDKALDIRSEADKKPIVTRNGWNITTEVKGLEPELQMHLYNQKADNDPGFQKGLVNALLTSNAMSKEDKISYIMGNIDPQGFSIDREMLPDNLKPLYDANAKQRRAEVEKMFIDLDVKNKYDPRLIEAAKDYGSQIIGLQKKIGEGYKRTEIDPVLYHQSIKDAKDKSDKVEEESKNTPISKTSVNKVGFQLNDFYDASTVDPVKRDLSGYQLPKGSYKLEKTSTIDGSGKEIFKVNRVNKPKESIATGNFIIDGYDKTENVIVLSKKGVSNDNTEEKFFVPINNENKYIVDRLFNKQLSKEEENKPAKKTIQWAM